MKSSTKERRPVIKRRPRIAPTEAVIAEENATRPTDGELALYRQALDRARADMQAFAYSVSHDLRAPLRAIQGFSKILIEDYSAQLEGEARQFLQHVVQNTQQLSSQIEDLLRFSRAGKSPPTKIQIETESFLEDVVEQLRGELPKQFVVEKSPLPPIFADPVLMRQVFAELVSNAAKFTSKTAEPKLTVASRGDDHVVALIFRDNGIGFEPAHAAKLFQVFQKLHSGEEFPGNGIGLAVIKRIVEAHGGCVEATAAPNQGAQFTITLPTEKARGPLSCPPNGAATKPPLL